MPDELLNLINDMSASLERLIVFADEQGDDLLAIKLTEAQSHLAERYGSTA